MDLEELTISIRVSADEAERRLSGLCDRLSALASPADAAAGALGAVAEAVAGQSGTFSRAARDADGYAAAVKSIENQAKRLQTRLSVKRVLAENLRELQKTVTGYQKGQKSQAEYNAALAEMSKRYGVSASSAKEAQSRIRALAATLTDDLESGVSSADRLSGALGAVEAGATIDGSVSVDTSAASAALVNLSAEAQALLALLSALGVANAGGASKRTGGGGGGGRSRKADAEAAERAAEEARKSAIEADYDYIDHRRHMNEITLKEYIAMLRGMYQKHALTADEIMALEEKIYDAERELYEKRVSQVETLADGVATAIENRYQKMLDAETERLDDSRDAWQAWADDTAAAIGAQIDALDALAETEDREARDAEELRTIAKLKQEIVFEQDAYSREQLSRKLEQAVADRAARLRKQETADRQDALQAQLEAVQAEAAARIAALDDEQAALEKQYAARMERAAVEAEAEKLLTGATQEELLRLIGEYAPEYAATGESLGERLAEGFIAGAGDIDAWFAGFNERVRAVQAGMVESLTAASEAFYQSRGAAEDGRGVTVHQTVNFNQPTETPGETARRIAQVNEALAGELLGAL